MTTRCLKESESKVRVNLEAEEDLLLQELEAVQKRLYLDQKEIELQTDNKNVFL